MEYYFINPAKISISTYIALHPKDVSNIGTINKVLERLLLGVQSNFRYRLDTQNAMGQIFRRLRFGKKKWLAKKKRRQSPGKSKIASLSVVIIHPQKIIIEKACQRVEGFYEYAPTVQQ